MLVNVFDNDNVLSRNKMNKKQRKRPKFFLVVYRDDCLSKVTTICDQTVDVIIFEAIEKTKCLLLEYARLRKRQY